jgi:hypothetical protein
VLSLQWNLCVIYVLFHEALFHMWPLTRSSCVISELSGEACVPNVTFPVNPVCYTYDLFCVSVCHIRPLQWSLCIFFNDSRGCHIWPLQWGSCVIYSLSGVACVSYVTSQAKPLSKMWPTQWGPYVKCDLFEFSSEPAIGPWVYVLSSELYDMCSFCFFSCSYDHVMSGKKGYMYYTKHKHQMWTLGSLHLLWLTWIFKWCGLYNAPTWKMWFAAPVKSLCVICDISGEACVILDLSTEARVSDVTYPVSQRVTCDKSNEPMWHMYPGSKLVEKCDLHSKPMCHNWPTPWESTVCHKRPIPSKPACHMWLAQWAYVSYVTCTVSLCVICDLHSEPMCHMWPVQWASMPDVSAANGIYDELSPELFPPPLAL